MKTTITERVARRRAQLRRAGLRPVQLWLPDTRSKAFAKECKRQSRMLRDDPHESEILAWLDKAAGRAGWR